MTIRHASRAVVYWDFLSVIEETLLEVVWRRLGNNRKRVVYPADVMARKHFMGRYY